MWCQTTRKCRFHCPYKKDEEGEIALVNGRPVLLEGMGACDVPRKYRSGYWFPGRKEGPREKEFPPGYKWPNYEGIDTVDLKLEYVLNKNPNLCQKRLTMDDSVEEYMPTGHVPINLTKAQAPA